MGKPLAVDFFCGSEAAAKACAKCRSVKLLNEFHRQPRRPGGRHSWCKACANEAQRNSRVRHSTPEKRARWNRATRYGLTDADMVAMRERQGGVCAICRRPMARECVDHCHDTGRVRGLLCHPCNIGLPYVEREGFRSAALAYLRGGD